MTKSKHLTLILTMLTGLSLLVVAPSAEARAPALESIEVSSLPGEAVQIRMRLSERPSDPLSFTIDNPARIAFDLPETTNALAQRRQDVGIGPLRTVTSA